MKRKESNGTSTGRPSAEEEYLDELGYRSGLNRVLGLFSSFAIQYSAFAVVGGLFAFYTVGFGLVGSALIWPWIVAGGLQMLVAVCIAEACSAYPVAGGAYNILTRISGRAVGWQTGWWIVVAHIASITASLVSLAPFIGGWLGIPAPTRWQVIGITVVLTLAALTINFVGVRITALFNNLGVTTEFVSALLATVVLGIVLFIGAHRHNGLGVLFSTQGTVHGSIVLPLLFAIVIPCVLINGFDISGTAGEETKAARTTVPRGMIIANLTAWVVGAAVILFLDLALTNPAGALKSSDPFRYIIQSVLGSTAGLVMEIFAVFSIWIAAVILILAGSRVFYAYARDGQIPAAQFFGKLNREHVPQNGAIVCALAAILILFWTYLLNVLLAGITVLWTAAYAVVLAAVWWEKIRGRFPAAAFRARWWRVVYPVALLWSLAVCGILTYQNPTQIGVAVGIVFVAGLGIYYGYVARKRPSLPEPTELKHHQSADQLSREL